MGFLTRFSLKNTVALIIIIILIATGGIISATSLKIESMPDITFPAVVVRTIYPNASPSDVLEDVTKPIEAAIVNMPGIKTLESYSYDNYSVVVAMLNAGSDAEEAKDEIETKINEVVLPNNAERPKVLTESFSSSPIYYLSVSSKDESISEDSLNFFVKDELIPALEGIDGVEKVSTIGDKVQEFKVYPKLEALEHYRITSSQLLQLLSANHVGFPIGVVKVDEEDHAVRLVAEYTNPEQIERTKLFLPSGFSGGLSYIQLGDLAEVEISRDAKFISRINEKPAISIRIFKTPDANEVETGDQINAVLHEFKQNFPSIELKTIYDTSVDIKKSINGMLKEGLMGAVMASIMILFFLRNFRSTFIVLLSIPLSILVSLIFMSWMGITLNIMTLGGLAIAIGRVVDDSIVVIENIYRNLQINRERTPELIRFATNEVSNAITSSTLTTVAVFVPIAFVSGILGEIFRPFAITVVCSLLASLIVAVTVVPLFAKILIMNSDKIKEHKPGRVAEGYKRLLNWSLQHKVITTVVAIVLLFASFALTGMLDVAFMPETEEKYVLVDIQLPKTTPLEETDELSKRVEEIFLNEPKVEYVESYIGTGFNGGDQRVNYYSSMFIKLQSDADINEITARFRAESEPMMPVGGKISINQLTAGGPIESYQVVLNGPDEEKLKQAAEMVKAKLEENPLMTNVTDNLSDTKTELIVDVDRDKAAEWGLTPVQIGSEIRNLIGDVKIGTIRIDNNEYDLTFGLKEEDVNSIEKLEALTILTPMGNKVRIEDVADIRMADAPSQIMRRNEKQYIMVSADITSADKGGVGQQATLELLKLDLPSGVTLSTAGVTEEIQNSFIQMFYALGAAVFMVYIVMVISFGNATAPLSILLSLPLAAIGGLFGLFITKSTIDITTLIGFLMLIGIVVTNAIVLVDRVQQQRERGLSTREALIEAGVTRLRPIIMTAVATIVALLPLALGFSEGALISKGLAIVVIGGLTTSTLLTLVVVPVGYEVLDKFRTSFLNKREKKVKHKETAEPILEV